MRRARLRCLVVAMATSCAITCAPQAVADPRDWVPWCSGNETPMDTYCRADPTQVFNDNAPGANPDVPLGVNPGVDPATGAG